MMELVRLPASVESVIDALRRSFVKMGQRRLLKPVILKLDVTALVPEWTSSGALYSITKQATGLLVHGVKLFKDKQHGGR